MSRPITLSTILLLTISASALQACSSLPGLRPALTIAAITILQELEDLLAQYEAAEPPAAATSDDLFRFAGAQMARHRAIARCLAGANGEVPDRTLKPYQKRFENLPRALP